jgi:hypothetical protein
VATSTTPDIANSLPQTRQTVASLFPVNIGVAATWRTRGGGFSENRVSAGLSWSGIRNLFHEASLAKYVDRNHGHCLLSKDPRILIGVTIDPAVRNQSSEGLNATGLVGRDRIVNGLFERIQLRGSEV